MRKLSKEYQIAFPSLSEVHKAIGLECKRLGTQVKCMDRKIAPAHLITALVLDFLRLPRDRRFKEAKRLAEELERFANLPEQPLGNYTPDPSEDGSTGMHAEVVVGQGRTIGHGGRKVPKKQRKDAVSIRDYSPPPIV